MTVPADPDRAVSVDDHLATVLAGVSPLEPIVLTLGEATGTLLAEDVVAPRALPPFPFASQGGYAVRLADIRGASARAPVVLPVVGGGPVAALSVQPGIAVRVDADIPLPAGAEAVVPLADTEPGQSRVAIRREVPPGYLVRTAGDDVTAGTTVLSAGAQLGSVQAALLASLGLPRVAVHPRPRVVVLATGDAFLEAGDRYEGGHVYDGVSHALAAAAREAGATPYRLATVPATVAALTAAIEDHLIQADAVLIAGVVRPAGYDPLGEVLARLGDVTLEYVNTAPGPVQGFGRLGADATPAFVLPPEPVAALVGFELFVRPALRRMLGAQATQRPQVRAAVDGDLTSVAGVREHVLAAVRHDRVRGYLAAPVGDGRPTLTGLAAANALLVVPESEERVPAGSMLTAVLLERRGA